MPICGYLVLTRSGAAAPLAERIAALPGCDVVRTDRPDLLLVVAESDGPGEDASLRARLEGLEGVTSLLLTFGDVAPAAGTTAGTAEG